MPATIAASAPFRWRRTTATLFKNGLLLLISLVMLFPIFSTLVLSFKREDDVHVTPPRLFPCDTATAVFDPGACRFVAEGYQRVVQARPTEGWPGFQIDGRIFTTYLPNSVVYAVASATLVTIIAALSAYVYSRYRFRGRRALLLGTLLVSGVPLFTLLLAILQIGNALRRSFPGYDERSFMVLVYVGFQLPFAIWIAKGFFDTIPRDLEEAALIDGCSRLGALARVVAPLAAPGMLSIFLLCFVEVWNDFTLNYFLLGKQVLRGVIFGVYAFIASAGISFNALAAACIVAMLPVIVVFLFARRVFFLAMTEGAVKG